MPRFRKAVDIWQLSPDQRRALPIGQWVYCGEPQYKGQFLGEGASTVVAHYRGHEGKRWHAYRTAIAAYGKSIRGQTH